MRILKKDHLPESLDKGGDENGPIGLLEDPITLWEDHTTVENMYNPFKMDGISSNPFEAKW